MHSLMSVKHFKPYRLTINETETVILVKLVKYLLTFLAVKGGSF